LIEAKMAAMARIIAMMATMVAMSRILKKYLLQD
jgi:hypothetical protein